jgi:hypothetical protein
MAVLGKLKHAWNAFLNQAPNDPIRNSGYGISYGGRPDRIRLNVSNERSLISSIYTRLGIDVASTEIRHVRLDDNDRFLEELDSGLNNCLSLEANIDQAARAFRQDIAMTLFDKGCACIVPVDTSLDPSQSGSYDIKTLRVGEIVQWYPRHVRVSLYNEATGRREEIVLEKKFVAIVENPLYSVMNEPNSTLQRLIRKINILDAIDEQSGSGKLDIIIQLPYVVKSEARKQQAEQRRSDIEFQLKGSKYGIAYTDGTEKITQLNRPAENNLLEQVKFLTEMLYSQLGLTKEVIDGTANEAAMLNYHFRTIEPLVAAIVEGMRRSFLTKTARSQKQSILYFRDPFKLVPVAQIAEIADKFTRNEILSSNEIRGIIGFKPAKDKKADQLINSNMPQADTGVIPADPAAASAPDDGTDAVAMGAFDSLDTTLDGIFKDLGVDENSIA